MLKVEVRHALERYELGSTNRRLLEDIKRQKERKEVEQHPVIGEAILSFLKGFETVSRVIRHHHENYDGSGYPDGLYGEGAFADSTRRGDSGVSYIQDREFSKNRPCCYQNLDYKGRKS